MHKIKHVIFYLQEIDGGVLNVQSYFHSGWKFLLQVTAELAEMDSAHPPVGIGMSRHRLCKGTGGG